MAKNKNKHSWAARTFEAQVAIDDHNRDVHLDPGDRFKGADFPKKILERWLGRRPQPTIKSVKGGS